MKRLIAVLCVASILVGCASVHPSDPRAAGVDLGGINAELTGRLVLVRLADGTELLAHDVSVSKSSVTLRRERFPHAASAWPAREVEELPISDVDSIEVTRKGIGAVQGALAGLGIGAAVGAGAGGMLSGPDDDISSFLGAVVFGLVGAPLGFLIGASVGATDVYDLSEAPEVAGSTTPSE